MASTGTSTRINPFSTHKRELTNEEYALVLTAKQLVYSLARGTELPDPEQTGKLLETAFCRGVAKKAWFESLINRLKGETSGWWQLRLITPADRGIAADETPSEEAWYGVLEHRYHPDRRIVRISPDDPLITFL